MGPTGLDALCAVGRRPGHRFVSHLALERLARLVFLLALLFVRLGLVGWFAFIRLLFVGLLFIFVPFVRFIVLVLTLVVFLFVMFFNIIGIFFVLIVGIVLG